MTDDSDHNIDLVVFDLGRVLVRIADDWQHAASLAGISLPVEPDCPRFTAGMREAVDLNERGAIDADQFDQRLAGLIDGRTPDRIGPIIDVWLRGCYEGAGELIAELHDRGIETACLSNTNARHWRAMFDPAETNGEDFTPLHNLRHKVGSHLVQSRKPEPAIYEHLETVTGRSPERILFFDDLPDNIEAARERRWRAEHVPRDLDNTIPHIRAGLKKHHVL